MTAEGSDRNAYRQTQVRQGNLKCEASNKKLFDITYFPSTIQLRGQLFTAVRAVFLLYAANCVILPNNCNATGIYLDRYQM